MSNDYFTYNNDVTPASLGRAEQIGEIFERIEAGFDKLPAANPGGTGFVGPLPVGAASELTHAVQYGQFVSWGLDVSANGYSLVNLRAPTADADAATKVYVDAQIQAYLIAGVDPSQIAISALGFGIVQPGETLVRSEDGLSWTSGVASGGGGIDFDGLTPTFPTRVNSAGNALETFDDRLQRASAALYAYQNL